MKHYKDINDFFSTPVPKHIQVQVDLNLKISEQVHRMLERKGWNQTDLANAMGKTNAEVSKWLSGLHNLTTASIAKMTAALGEPIILTADSAKKEFSRIQYVYIGVSNRIYKKSSTYEDFKQREIYKTPVLKIA